MARINYIEKLSRRSIDITYELMRISKLFTSVDFKKDFDLIYPFIENKLGTFNNKDYISLIISNTDKSYDIPKYLDYCDAFLTIYKAYKKLLNDEYYLSFYVDFEIVLEGINFILDRLDYQIFVDDHDNYIITTKDAVAEEVASISTYEKIKWRILEYNEYNISLEEKKNILRHLYIEFEKIRSLLSNTYSKKIGGLINCIRHNKDDQEDNPYSFYFKNEEEWCDKLYDLLLESFLHAENKKIIKEIDLLTKK